MISDPVCERTDLPASMCSHCRGLAWDPVVDVAGQLGDVGAPGLREYRDPEANARRSWAGRAEHRSTCPGCGETIKPGDRLVRVDDRFVCGPCADNDGVLS